MVVSQACLAVLPAWSLHRAVSAQVKILCETAPHAVGSRTLGDFFTEQETLDFPIGTRDEHIEVLDDNIIYKTLMLRGVSL